MIHEIGLVSGGFDPLHEGHILLLNHARAMSEHVIVGLNSDDWLVRKKGKFLLNWGTRYTVTKSLRQVDDVWHFDDADGTAKSFLTDVSNRYRGDNITFYNGGDRGKECAPEGDFAWALGIKTVYGSGGNFKANSSSKLLEKWTNGN